MKALFISADNFEDLELFVPYYRLLEAGIDVDLASMKTGTIKGKHGYEINVSKTLDEVRPEDYQILVLPGGKAPEAIRNVPRAQEIARHFMEREKPVAAICHGPQTLISAGLLKGRRATSYQSVAPEMRDAGVSNEDSEVVVEGKLVTSRQPEDLPAFTREMMRMIGR